MKMIVKNIEAKEIEELKSFGLQINNEVKYLEIILSKKLSTLMEDNYLSLLKEIQKEYEKWNKLQLSFMGRIANIVPTSKAFP